MPKKSILIIDDEENMRHMLSVMLKKKGFEVVTAEDGVDGLSKITARVFDFVLCDIKMPNMDGMTFLKSLDRPMETTTIIMMSAYGTIDLAIEAVKLGAYDFISKPFKSDEVMLAIQKADERENLKRENVRLKEKIKTIEGGFTFGEMIGKSKSMQAVFTLAKRVAGFNTTVLITGESGTGKELVAKGIHRESDRKNNALVPVNCGEIPENLLESEFFGHKKGAFTGADRARKGLFEQAHKGTLFLDEIGELSLPLQVKLLRVLQENEIRPVGGSETKKVDVRVLAATSKNLEDEINKKRFREDLFYRLNVMRISLPPLGERIEDIPRLCGFFISRFNLSLGAKIQGVSQAAMTGLLKKSWPGNVRQLENAIERAMILCEGQWLGPEHFQIEDSHPPLADDMGRVVTGYSIKAAKIELEKLLISRALGATNGNRTHAAKMLEISHPSLLSKMKAYGIE